MANDLFISYAREDAGVAKRLADALVALRGWAVWWDTSLRTGEQFPARIQEAVASARCVVVLWSHNSIDSNWVAAEASEGWNRGILVPVLLDDSEPPMPFRQTQSRDLSAWKGSTRDATLLALIEDIQRIHARGNAATVEEITAREARRRAFRRRQIAKGIGTAAVVASISAGAWYAWNTYEAGRDQHLAAENLAQRADDVRQKALTLTPEENKRTWWATLTENREHLDGLQLSALLAVEAWHKARTARTEKSLRDSLALLPVSDQFLEIDFDDMPNVLAFSPSGKLLAAAGGSQGTLVWDLEHDAVIAHIAHGGTGGLKKWHDQRGTFTDSRASGQVMAFHPVRDEIATAGPDATVRIWDAGTGRELRSLPHDSMATAVQFDSKGQLLATSAESGTISLWDAQSGQLIRSMKHGAAVYWIVMSPSSTYLASVGRDKAVVVWRVADGKQLQRIVHDGLVGGARFDPDEKLIATFGSDIETRLWDLGTGAQSWRLAAQSDASAGVIFDRATRTMVVGGANGTITWWDTAERSRRFSIPSGSTYLTGMTASADRRFLITTSDDSEARAWEFGTGRLLTRMPYSNWLMGLAVSADGQRFAATGRNEDIRVIEVMRIWPEDPGAVACVRLRRNLTHAEWQEYLGAEKYRRTCPDIKEKAEDEE